MKSTDFNIPAKAGMLGLIASTPLLNGEVISQSTKLTLSNSTGNLLLWDIDGANSTVVTGINNATAALTAIIANSDADAGIFINSAGQPFYTFIGAVAGGTTTLQTAAIQWSNATDQNARNLGTNYELGPNNFSNTNAFGLGYIQTSLFSSGSTGFIGFRYKISGGNSLYGWAEIELNTSSNEFSILQWAYEDDGSIDTGLTGAGNGSISTPIPEPAGIATGLAVLALGAAGLRRWRKQNNNI